MSATVKKFYNLFWTDPTCQAIFSLHRAQLLEDEVELIFTKEKYYAQRLVLTNSQKRKTEAQIAMRNENENIELIHNLQNAAKKYLDDDKLKTYFKSKFGRAVKKIQTDRNKIGGWIKLAGKLIISMDNERDLFKLLADYYLIPNNIENLEQFEKYVEAAFHSHMKEFLEKENLFDLTISIDLVSTYYNHKIKNNLVLATKHFTDVLYDNENYQDRINLFDNLYEIEVIKGGKLKSYFECVNCSPNTLNGVLMTNIKPSNLKLKCPCCNKELFYIVPYELDKVIYENIVHKDGLLFFAIQHLLEQYKYKFKANQTFLGDIEFDFCLFNNKDAICDIIEVKMFKTNRPGDAQVGNIRQAVSQIKKAIDKMMSVHVAYKDIQKSLITNISSDAIYKLSNKELSKDLKEYNIILYTISDFYSKIKR